MRGGRPGTWDHLPRHGVWGVPSVLLHEADLAAFCDVPSPWRGRNGDFVSIWAGQFKGSATS